MATYFLGVLEIGLGNYGPPWSALGLAYKDDTPLVGTKALPDLVEAAARAGKRELAELALQRLEDRATASGTPLALGLLARSRARWPTPGEARKAYEECARSARPRRHPSQLARAHLLYGEWLRRQRQRREARDAVADGSRHVRRDGLPRLRRTRTRWSRAPTGRRAQRETAFRPRELTPQEAQIAALVSRGEANRDIAAALSSARARSNTTCARCSGSSG